jgi:hypothetical protein
MLKATRPKEQQDVKNCINCTFLPYAQDNYAGYFVFSFILLCLSGWQATGKLYHLRLRVECIFNCNLQSQARTHALYELLGNPTT